MSRDGQRKSARSQLPGIVRTGHGYHDREVMNMEERRHFDVLVIGGGPAGMAAAACAAESGVRVGIVDDNFKLGGQIWRGDSGVSQNKDSSNFVQRLTRSGATTLCGHRV